MTLFTYDQAGHLTGEYASNGAAIRETVYLGNTPVAVIAGGVASYIHTDHLNAPRAIVNTAGITFWRWDSEPFGTDKPNEDPDGDGKKVSYNLRFPGQYFDSETGLHYNYFRDYSPSLGRYIQSDPIGLKGGLNTYAYVGGNPVSAVDPRGLKLSLTIHPIPIGGSCNNTGSSYTSEPDISDWASGYFDNQFISDWTGNIGTVFSVFGETTPEFWANLDPEFWASLEEMGGTTAGFDAESIATATKIGNTLAPINTYFSAINYIENPTWSNWTGLSASSVNLAGVIYSNPATAIGAGAFSFGMWSAPYVFQPIADLYVKYR